MSERSTAVAASLNDSTVTVETVAPPLTISTPGKYISQDPGKYSWGPESRAQVGLERPHLANSSPARRHLQSRAAEAPTVPCRDRLENAEGILGGVRGDAGSHGRCCHFGRK
jgi:hypothetical protein